MRYLLRNIYYYLRYKDERIDILISYLQKRLYRVRRQVRRLKEKYSPFANRKKVYGDTLCALPWVHYFISERGHNYPCCISTDDGLPNIDEYGEVHKVYDEETFTKSWNSDYMKDIRLQMQAGQRPKPCERCYKFEDLGVRSHRNYANRRWEAHLDKIVAKTESDGSAPMKLYSADIRLGNLCNLKCRMCSPISSKGLATEWQKLKMMTELEAKEYLDVNWFEKPEFWDMFLKYSDDLQSLHFAGGEPFIIKTHFTFLRSLIDRKISYRLALTYNTNLTMLPSELLELWKHFRHVDLMVSLDGMEDVNHYIRYPSNWTQIHKNLKYVHDHMTEYRIRNVHFNVTVQAYNIFSLPKLVDFLIAEYPKANFPNLSLLFGPSELSIQILPKEMKANLTEMWSNYLNQNKARWSELAKWPSEGADLIKNVEGIIQFLNQEDATNLLPRFKVRTQAFDRNRKQNCTDVVPELAPIFN